MGISYDSLYIFGSNVYDDKKENRWIEPWDFECKIQAVYNVALSENLYETLIEEGANEETIRFEEYASMYNDKVFGDYKVLMLFDYGNFVADYRNVAVGFIVDLNKDSLEKIGEKKEIFLQELEDFKSKTDLTLSTSKFDSLTYVL